MDLGLTNKNFAVFGGTRGMGWATVCALAENAANVFVFSRHPEQYLKKAHDIAEAYAGSITLDKCDLTGDRSVEEAIDKLLDQCDQVHGMAVTNYTAAHGPAFTETETYDWDARYQDVLMASVRPCKALIPHMIEKGGGSIVLTSAYSALSPGSTLFAYASQKAAVINLSLNLAQTYGAKGIRANCVCPGYIKTARAEERIAKVMEREGVSETEAGKILVNDVDMNIAMGRIGNAREVGDVIAFLLSERTSYMSGAVVSVDGAASR